jgi:putative transposase
MGRTSSGLPISYIAIATGFVYLQPFLMLGHARVIAYAISRSVVRSMRACAEGRPNKAARRDASTTRTAFAICFRAYRHMLAEHGLVGSMADAANPYDNAKAESFIETRNDGLYQSSH